MKDNNLRPKKRFMSFGFFSILLSFVMICIIIFSALLYMTVNADYRLTQKLVTKNTQYYQAEKEAYIYLAEIDDSMTRLYEEVDNEADFMQSLTFLFADKSGEYYEEEGHSYFEYYKPVNEKQQLYVKLDISFPGDGENSLLKVVCWKTVSESLSSGVITIPD